MGKGIELSVSFLVVLIIAVVLFGMGLKFAYDIFRGASGLSDVTLADIHKSIQEMRCRSEDRVCYGTEKIEVRRKDVGFFSVKVTNILDVAGDTEFELNVIPSRYMSKSGESEDCTTGPCDRIEYKHEVVSTILNNEDYKFGIAVLPMGDAPSGTYSFSVEVMCGRDDSKDVEEMCKNYGANILRVVVP